MVSRRLCGCLCALALMLTGARGDLTAQREAETESPPDAGSSVVTPESAATPELADAERERRQHTVAIGTLLLVGVAAIGLLLVAATLIWGAKVRRLSRGPHAEPTRSDDLWFLRKPAAMDRPASIDNALSDEAQPPPRPSEPDDSHS